MTAPAVAARLAALPWPELERALNEDGYARTPAFLTGEECAAIVALYEDDRLFRCLHQDLYGEAAFPLQLAAFLTPPEAYQGGEFLLVEQRPRAQSIGHAIRPGQGELVVFPTRERPATGKRGAYRCQVRHGVSRIHVGRRYTLGVIFHDAR